MKRVAVKPYLAAMMKQHFPDYELTRAVGMFYVFRKKDTDGLYRYIVFQREGAPYNQLIITECAVGYNKNWNGYPAFLMGCSDDIGCLMSGKRYCDARLGWVEYGDSEASIAAAMEELKAQIDRYVRPFLEDAKKRVLADELMRVTKEVMEAELKKETKEGLEEIKDLIAAGTKPNCGRSISDHKNYAKWCGLIDARTKSKAERNRFILICLRDYLNYYS